MNDYNDYTKDQLIEALKKAHHTIDMLRSELSGEDGQPKDNLQISKDTLITAFFKTPIPMLIASAPSGILISVNEACKTFFETHDEPEKPGKPLEEIKITWNGYDASGNPVPENQMPLQKALRGIKTDQQEFRIELKNGKTKWLIASGTPVCDDSGSVIQAFVIFWDITELKQMQAALSSTAQDLQRLNSQKDKFFSVISHDLKSPFTSMLGISSYILEDFDNLSSEEIRTYIGHIHSSGRNLYNLIDNLLKWSLYESGIMVPAIQKILLSEQILSAIHTLSGNALKKNIMLKSGTRDDIYVQADPDMLQSVLQNLISNAIKFSYENSTISVESSAGNGFAHISVCDNGLGIAEENIPRLFNLETRFSTSGTANEKGTGLGLLLSKEMVEKNGGTISVESVPGKGSRFTFSVPLHTQS